MATEHVEQAKQPEQSEVSSPSGWNVTTSRMVIEFYKENRVLWDRYHKDWQKFTPQESIRPFGCQAKAIERAKKRKKASLCLTFAVFAGPPC